MCSRARGHAGVAVMQHTQETCQIGNNDDMKLRTSFVRDPVGSLDLHLRPGFLGAGRLFPLNISREVLRAGPEEKSRFYPRIIPVEACRAVWRKVRRLVKARVARARTGTEGMLRPHTGHPRSIEMPAALPLGQYAFAAASLNPTAREFLNPPFQTTVARPQGPQSPAAPHGAGRLRAPARRLAIRDISNGQQNARRRLPPGGDARRRPAR